MSEFYTQGGAMLNLKDARVALIGLGYVGLPLAVEFGKHFPTVGFDIKSHRVEELRRGQDRTLEVEPELLQATTQLTFTDKVEDLASCNIFIVTVPTPIDKHKRPDLEPLQSASRTVAKVLTPGDLVIYESTVFPGATEEICVPLLEEGSGLRCNQDFHVGYSPERINPGDKEHRLSNIVKVTSGSTPEAAELVDQLYGTVVSAGTHRAPSIRVAEAAKVIENTQRDVNIALINELALLFAHMGIDTREVLEAAGTKWNFLPFRPGLVGGHCISVDPYYLTFKAQELGYYPQIILSGRQINDGMGAYVAAQVMKLMTQRRIHVVDANVLVMGLAFKENCPDLRNSRVIDIIREFQSYHANVEVYDPWVDPDEAELEYGVRPVTKPGQARYDAIVLAVAHEQFVAMGAEQIRALGTVGHVLFDVKCALPKATVDGRL
jgi:UDP-N-acetyl-D-galactosamine dehydrogenase